MNASGSYPFGLPGSRVFRTAIGIDFNWTVEFTVLGKGVVGISYWGWHDSFPDYEGQIDGTWWYSYMTPHQGPGPFVLGPGSNKIIPGRGFQVKAQTPHWCSCP